MRLCNVRLTALFAISANIMFLCDQASSILTVSALLALTTFLCGRYWSIGHSLYMIEEANIKDHTVCNGLCNSHPNFCKNIVISITCCSLERLQTLWFLSIMENINSVWKKRAEKHLNIPTLISYWTSCKKCFGLIASLRWVRELLASC